MPMFLGSADGSTLPSTSASTIRLAPASTTARPLKLRAEALPPAAAGSLTLPDRSRLPYASYARRPDASTTVGLPVVSKTLKLASDHVPSSCLRDGFGRARAGLDRSGFQGLPARSGSASRDQMSREQAREGHSHGVETGTHRNSFVLNLRETRAVVHAHEGYPSRRWGKTPRTHGLHAAAGASVHQYYLVLAGQAHGQLRFTGTQEHRNPGATGR